MTAEGLAHYAVRAYLLDRDSVADILVDRLFAPELPEGEDESMPRRCAVLSQSGGPGSRGYLPLDAQRVDVRAYGETAWQAARVARVVHLELKALRRVTVSIDQPEGDPVRVLIHSIEPVGGFIDLDDAATRWPLVFRPYQVLIDEREVA